MNLARNWRLKNARYRLEGSVCRDCGATCFPSHDVCPECRSSGMVPHEMNGHGKLYSFTIVRQPPHGYEEQVPYAIGLVKMDEGPTVEGQLTDVNSDELRIGDRMEVVTRKLRVYGKDGMIVYGYKFRPVTV